MALPQKENGYVAIANKIMEALASIRIPGEARQVLDVIFRKTYGWNKKEDEISLSQFRKTTGLTSPHIIRARNKLLKMNIITVAQKGNSNILTYRFQKDYTKWKSLPKKVTIAQKDNQRCPKRKLALPKKVDTKDTITKPSITKPSSIICFDFKKRKFLNITTEDKAGWIDAYPAVDVDQELREMREWLLSHPEKAKKRYRQFITGWLSRRQDKLRTKSSYEDKRKKALDDWEKKPLED